MKRYAVTVRTAVCLAAILCKTTPALRSYPHARSLYSNAGPPYGSLLEHKSGLLNSRLFRILRISYLYPAHILCPDKNRVNLINKSENPFSMRTIKLRAAQKK